MTHPDLTQRLEETYRRCCLRFVVHSEDALSPIDTDCCVTCGFFRRAHEVKQLLAELIALRAALAEAWAGWLPTATNVNALPEPLRHYIHQLETVCDPAGDQRNLVIARDMVQQLQAALAEAQAERDALRVKINTGIVDINTGIV